MTISLTNKNISTSPEVWKLAKSTFRILLMSVSDKTVRKIFEKNMNRAYELKNMKEANKVLQDIEKFLKHGKAYLTAGKYDKIPTFDQAVMDCLANICKDVELIPDLDDYYTDVQVHGVFDEFGEHTFGKQSLGKNCRGEGIEIETMIKKYMIIATAPTQSGKSNFIICTAFRSMLRGFTPVIVLRNLTGDMEQIEKGLLKVLNQITEYLDKHKVINRRFDFENKIVSGSKLDNKRTVAKFTNSLQRKEPCLIVCLANETQLGRVINIAKKYPLRVDSFFDELDGIGYGVNKNGELCDTAFSLNELKNLSHQTFGVTATPFDVIFSEEELKNQINLARGINKDYPAIPTIVYNGSGCMVQHEGMTPVKIAVALLISTSKIEY